MKLFISKQYLRKELESALDKIDKATIYKEALDEINEILNYFKKVYEDEVAKYNRRNKKGK